jgi:hypothetical protein
MKKLGLCILAMAAFALMLSGTAFAQGDNSYYFVTYYSNNVSGAPDGTVRFINDGDTSGSLYAAFFVFDDSQELSECGACPVSADGLLSEDVKTELTGNPLTGHSPARGVIKVISSSTPFDVSGAGPGGLTATPGLRGWATHIQRATPTSGSYATTETPVADSNLGAPELTLLEDLCYFEVILGSGQGTITCTAEDKDF